MESTRDDKDFLEHVMVLDSHFSHSVKDIVHVNPYNCDLFDTLEDYLREDVPSRRDEVVTHLDNFKKRIERLFKGK